ncbi:hypothetical protein NDU88_002024 [Pleurodeles waltl]|uniref:Uncharacterized protein n=1 Tax=Pleurodeles waltl TaxID=8319 RepID=A0AAV7NF63_PLEWA|nr:hypothetical protein NDU88_002024 [Pleurodeles waltl]
MRSMAAECQRRDETVGHPGREKEYQQIPLLLSGAPAVVINLPAAARYKEVVLVRSGGGSGCAPDQARGHRVEPVRACGLSDPSFLPIRLI